MKFKLKSQYKPAGDQPKAIEKLTAGLNKGLKKQTLLGVTGSGKTFTIANVIEKIQKPTLVIAHNKTLAAQLCNEFREFFPNNAVEYFVSYYDYYQPEAYMPGSDTYIEKEAQINEEIDRLRHACTQALLTRKDVIIVASVSCIYGLGSPVEYEKIVLHLSKGQKLNREALLEHLINIQFERTNSDLKRGSFRLRGQVFEIVPVNEEIIYRLEISEQIDLIEKVDPITRKVKYEQEDLWIFPAKHYVISEKEKKRAIEQIEKELKDQLAIFKKKGKILEYERLKRRVKYDLEMIKNIGYCQGIENYSRHFDGRNEGEPPFTLLDYFKKSLELEVQSSDFLTVIDESHVTVPQIRGMYAGDKSRKDVLVKYGFRLPSACDNRPLNYEEFDKKTDQVIYVSATPDIYELEESKKSVTQLRRQGIEVPTEISGVVEQIVRPTGLVDPEVIIKPVTGKRNIILNEKKHSKKSQGSKEVFNFTQHDGNKSQIEDLLIQIEERIKKGERVLVTTLTKKMAEDLSDYLLKKKIKVHYLHSDVKTVDRIDIITKLRQGKIDVIVGVNLLREGLDIPEVSLVAILDADKEGFLRNEKSLIQTIGRAARNVNGRVILYADVVTKSIKKAVAETTRRRNIQLAYNKKYNITPQTIQKNIRNILADFGLSTSQGKELKNKKQKEKINILKLDLIGDKRPVEEIIKDKEKLMKEAAKNLEFELATILRDEIRELKAKKNNF